MAWVFKHSDATGNDRLVLLSIADEADDDGSSAFPSIERLSIKARVPKRTVMRCLTRLEESGGLIVHRPEVKGRGRFNTYVVVMRNGDTLTARNGDTLTDPATVPPSETVRKGAERCTPLAYRSQTHRPIDPESKTTPTPLPPVALPIPHANGVAKATEMGFDEFWQVYPRHEAKRAAQKAWPGAVKRAGGAGPIIIGANRYANDPNRTAQFTAHPASWLNRDRWLDDPAPPRTNGAVRESVGDYNVRMMRERQAKRAAQNGNRQGAIDTRSELVPWTSS